MVAAALSKDIQTRKVRASQGRMPDNVRWRQLDVYKRQLLYWYTFEVVRP